MGLFRRGSKKKAKAAAEFAETQTVAGTRPTADVEQATTESTQATADTTQRAADTGQAKIASREVTAEARPDPDKPGWGRIVGQTIGKPREDGKPV